MRRQLVKKLFVLEFIVGSRVLAASCYFLVTAADFVLIGAQVFGFQLLVKQQFDRADVKVLFDGRQWPLLAARLVLLLLEQLHDISCKNQLVSFTP